MNESKLPYSKRFTTLMNNCLTPADRSLAPLILLVDDDVLIRTQLKFCLQGEGYRIVEAEDGKQGLSAYKTLCPDIVLLDAMMPDMNGFECCSALQTLPGGDRTPVLIITGLEDQKSVDQAFAVGAADYVTKPVHWAVLRQRVRRLIQQSQLQQQLEAANRELQRLVSIDGLTEIANRRCFDERLAQEWKRSLREKLPLSLVLCDIDCFKGYNDTYGHQAGDRCLQEVAKAVNSTVRRSTDLAARYGGEEFAVILPNTPLEGALHVAERIRLNVKALAIPHVASSVCGTCVSLSLGVAAVCAHSAMNPARLIAVADAALYQAKIAGRDRSVAELGLLML